MPNLAQTLKQEIARISRREIGPMVQKQANTVRILKSQVATLKQQVADLEKDIGKGGPAPAEATMAATGDKALESITGKDVKNQRKRLGLTQVAFAKLVGVSTQGVVKWEAKYGILRLHAVTQKKLAKVMGKA